MGYQTPESLSGATCLQLVVPDDLLLRAAIIGALSELGKVYNWEPFGSVTPDAVAALMQETLYALEWQATCQNGGSSMAELHETRQSSTQAVSTLAKLAFNSVFTDPDDWWNPTTNSFVVPSDGLYLVSCSLPAVENGRTVRVYARINDDTSHLLGTEESAVAQMAFNGAMVLPLTAGNSVSLWAGSITSVTFFGYGGDPMRFQLTAL